MPDSMIERVARELRECGKRNGSVVHGDDENGWREYVHDARAVLAVMREPTDDMVDAGFLAERDEDGDMSSQHIWTAMLDTALEDLQ